MHLLAFERELEVALVELLARMYGLDVNPGQMHDLFARYSMAGRYDDLIENYSHGMRKKTQLVAALLMRRPLLVVDETLNGMDLEALHLCEGCAKDYLSNVAPGTPADESAAEAGFPGLEAEAWWGVFAPAGTPAPLVARMM